MERKLAAFTIAIIVLFAGFWQIFNWLFDLIIFILSYE
jgi:hypothetical protein